MLCVVLSRLSCQEEATGALWCDGLMWNWEKSSVIERVDWRRTYITNKLTLLQLV